MRLNADGTISVSNRTTLFFSVLFSAAVIVAAGLVLKPRFTDLRLAYGYVTNQMFRDVASVTQINPQSDEKIKEDSPSEYNKRLSSIDPNARLSAIKEIEGKSDPQFVPQMIRLLNDNTRVRGTQSSDPVQISEAAKNAVIKLLRDNIVREPGNISQFLPLFQAGLNSSTPEKLGVIEILSALREPTAYPFLKRLTVNKGDPEITSRASNAVLSLIPDSVMAPEYYSLKSRRVEFMYLLMASGIIITIAAIVWLLKSRDIKFAAICLLAVVMDVGLGVLVHAELNRGTLTQKSLQDAVNAGNLLALRTMCYSDYTPYPGDSFFCQRLVQLGGIRVIKSLISLPGVEPDDLSYLKTDLKVRVRWIMARIIVLNLGQASLDAIINSGDPEVSFAVAKTLDELKIQNKEVKRYLERLTQNHEPDKVRNLAEKTLADTKKLPAWPM